MSDYSQDQNLMLGDRINWPYILGSAVLKFHGAIVQVEGSQSEQEVRESALALFYSIPDVWIVKDKQLREDLENSVEIVPIDTRIIYLGRRVGKPKCPNLAKKTCIGCPTIETCDMKKIDLQPYRLYNACVNVFQRRGLLSKTIYSENIVPTPETLEQEVDETPITSDEQKELNLLKKKITR